MDVEDLVAAFRASSAPLLALDFDGTLAPIVADPTTSRPVPGAVDALVALASRGVQIAVVTGRDAPTVLALGGLDVVPGIVIVGLYGMQTWHDGHLESPAELPVIARLRAELPALVPAASGGVVEDKGLSLVVHTRSAPDPAAALAALRAPVSALAAELGLEVHDGKFVLELRPPGFDKGRALRSLVERFSPDVTVFAGDDVGDVPALEYVASLPGGFGVLADSPDVPPVVRAAAGLAVDGPAGVLALLHRLIR